MWVHGAPNDLSEAINMVAREQGVDMFQTSSDMASDTNFIHPYGGEGDLQDICPKGLQSFVDLARPQPGTLSALLRASLPASTIVNKKVENLTVGLSFPKLRILAKQHLHGGPQVPAEHVEVVTINKVSTVTSKELGPTSVVDWSTTNAVSALVRPLEHCGLFAPEKTYLLCGMTGDLGISVCLWMVDHGTRNVVLTSRNPNVSPSVLDYLSRKGATVRPMAVDIVKMDSLRAAYAEIKSRMPPIGGIINAAMVLRDRLFHHLSWEKFAAVLAPKMMGSKNLDEVFGDEQLDFFICFSSTTSIVGSIGQSAYAAANHYMASLVQQRLQRGLAGSIVHIAILTGFGYIFRRDSDHSETDLHEMLAEAIVCGRPGSGQPAELITGIRATFQGEWRDDPRLSCYNGQQELQDDLGREQSVESASVKAQLAAAEDPAECLVILEKCFALALGNLLEIDPEKLASNISVANLGIDSLVAIRIREWFLEEMGVDVPVLKIMSDSYPMSRMCDDVLVEWRRLKKS
ncbi:KR domain-containing protein [Aspergillus varians]